MDCEDWPAEVDDCLRGMAIYVRSIPPEERMLMGLRMFNNLCNVLTEGIHREHPNANRTEVQEMLAERLKLIDMIENGGVDRDSFFSPVPA